MWCAQHDAETLAPAQARNDEPPSLSGFESVGVVRFLMRLELPSPEVVAAVEGAVAWFESAAIEGLRLEWFTNKDGERDRRVVEDPSAGTLWARFYELETNRPLFVDRDEVFRYRYDEIQAERRRGYGYYGTWLCLQRTCLLAPGSDACQIPPMKLGIDCLLENADLRRELNGRRVALLGHPASVTRRGQHTLDALAACSDVRLTAAFGPQHGMRGDKQDNMIESENYVDPALKIPVFSLYGQVRRPTDAMLDSFDVLLVDLQDIGTRIYTFITTLGYLLEAGAALGKSVWVLDRPNPAGRPIEGTILEPGWESFIGIGPLIMRHGLTLGEFARWYVTEKSLTVDLRVIPMEGYDPEAGPGHGWPVFEWPWVNPSPNASSLNMARCFPGTVLVEGTTLSEGRGTTNPLELVGAPDVDFGRVLRRAGEFASPWLVGCTLRQCFFEPTFQKHQGRLCSGVQIHTDSASYRHAEFRPYRVGALLLKAIRLEYPDYELWHRLPYEYETGRLAIDLLSGGTFLREWVDHPAATVTDFEGRLGPDEQSWAGIRRPFLVY